MIINALASGTDILFALINFLFIKLPFLSERAMTYRILFTSFLVWVVSTTAHSQADQFRFKRLDIHHGLSNNQVNCFLKDSRGFTWIGTLSGLNRFDGYSFKVYRNNVRDTTSIPNNDVRKLFEDPHGRLWVNTNFTSCVYDPDKEFFLRNTNAVLREFGIPDGIIRNIVKDASGNYWFIHETEGLFLYETSKNKSIRIIDTREKKSSISSFVQDSKGNYWAIYRNGFLEKLDGKNYNVVYGNNWFQKLNLSETSVYELTPDADDHIWIYLPDLNLGVFYFDPSSNSITHITTRGNSALKLNNNIVKALIASDDGLIWIGTDHGGINLIDKKNSIVKYLRNDVEDDQSLSQNSINTLYKDPQGIIWVGTFKKGINYYHRDMNKFALYHHQSSNAKSLPYDDINSFVEDDNGNLWIGTNGGGLIYFNTQTQTFKQYLNDPKDPQSLSNNVIVSLCMDSQKKLWIGTYYGGLDCFDGEKFIHYRHDRNDPFSLSNDNIWEIMEDSNHNLWIGTLFGSLNFFDRDAKKFKKFGMEEGILSPYVPALMEDKDGNIWVGTGYGISLLEKGKDKFVSLRADGTSGSLSHNNVLSFLNDNRDLVWVGTQDGLNLYNKAENSFRVFREEDGLPHNTILSILEDNGGNLWMSTPNGISNLVVDEDPSSPSFKPVFKNYDELDGLQAKQFNESAALKTRNGALIFGGPNGFNIFRPEDISLNRYKPPVVLTGLQINNKSVAIGEELDGKVMLSRSVTNSSEIEIGPDHNIFSIEFAALGFLHPEKNQYKYKLEGFNEEWVTTNGTNRKVTYTNLDPGQYVFKVIASNSDGFWNEEGAVLKITILPPFWKTNWAFALYALIILGALFLARQLMLERERMRYRIEQERQAAQRVHELDMMKIKFFTNISHEFRTPLSLILTPVERMLSVAKDAREREQFQMIHRNARRLLNLVNQLLDFRKMEVQQLTLNSSEGDVIKFIEEVVHSFSDISEKKNIHLSFLPGIKTFEMTFDQDKLEKILFNLLSNAFKFTPEGGNVTVEVNPSTDKEGFRWLEVKVIDTGIGIPAEKQDKIFERFFQHDLPRSMVNQGTGIGLSITREFVRLHGGKITAESEPDRGSCFTVLIPATEIAEAAKSAADLLEELEPKIITPESVSSYEDIKNGKKKAVVLLVEDNEDFRFYLKDNLKIYYQILEARDGVEGWNMAHQHIPDLIVSDVMMPEMNGIELCRKVKINTHTSHIPVILLTARTASEQKLEGYQVGADDYVTKPFNFEILLSRIRNLIAVRAALHKSFNKKIDIKASEVPIMSLDETLIKKAVKLVEEKLSDPDFSVEDLSKELGMSRVHLYKKLLSLTGKSPIEFIRIIRLQRAAQLLEKSQLTVAEIAYKVGFNNPKYFAKYFKEEFNVLPSSYAARRKG